MDGTSRKLLDDCFLRPVADARSTNKPIQLEAPKVTLKTEMQVLRLSDESQKMCMDTLKSINGDDFRLDDATKYKDRGGKMKKSYWEDRGTLIVQSVKNYSSISKCTLDGSRDVEQPEERLRRYALLKLENYGFALSHCIESYDFCEGDIHKALLLLYRKYMRLADEEGSFGSEALPMGVTENDLLEMRNDEKEALESIYDKSFEEKQKNEVWSLKFRIDHLLQHSPSEVRKAREAALMISENNTIKAHSRKTKELARCRNFDKDGICKFGNKCRFVHIKPVIEMKSEETIREKAGDNSDDKCFYLEIRFPPHTKYPYEAPYIYLKTTCHDIPTEVRLRISRKLYQEARESCKDGIPCIFSISELLQMDESLSQSIDLHRDPFPNPNKSLFYVEDPSVVQNHKDLTCLPTHYEKGMTSREENTKRDKTNLEKEDRLLLKRFMEKRKDERYKKMMSCRQNLPAFSKMVDILSLLETSQILVISGETGCGKSTQVPQFILDNWFFKSSQLNSLEKMPHVEVICTQPRRLSAIGVAERVADERGERIGQIVGYQIRLENKISAATRLTFCTTGILLRRLASEPLLDSITHIIVDEVHERSEESDFLLLILKRILPLRPDLKVILMSATLNAKLFSDYFGNIPVLDIPGRTFPVEQLFLEDILERCDFVMELDSQYSRKVSKKEEEQLMREMEYADIKAENIVPPTKLKDEKLTLSAIYSRYYEYCKKTCKSIYLMEPMKVNPELIESVLRYVVEGDHDWPNEGTILIFLPGMQEIQTVHEALCDSSLFGPRSNKYILVPLHSTLSSDEQAAVFRPAPKGKRKIVLSTNIAETSVTIDDCVFVVDYGLMKEKNFDANRNMESLELVYASRANANQRKGRAGRVMPGVCIHLYTQHRFKYNFLAQPVPEIHRVPLEQLVLRIKTLPNFEGLNVIEVLGQTIEPPTEESVISAVTRLQDVGALDEEQQLTPLGHHLSALPVDVRIGKLMLFGAIFQCLDSILTIAACLSHKSPFLSPFNKREEAERRKREFSICNSDHLTCLLAYKKWLEVSKRNFYASRNYADEHFLSLKTLQTISDIKYQFLELLVSIGFVPINVPRMRKNVSDNILDLTGCNLNVNGDNNRLLISLLCASLYPNVVKIMTPERSYVQTVGGALPKLAAPKDLRFKTLQDGYVAIHPSSVNANISSFQSPFLVYQEKVKTSRIFIRECSMLPLTSLLLFAGSDLKIELHSGDFLFLLEDGWIIVKAHNHEMAEMIQCLRNELLKLLEEKIRDPCLNLLNHENGCKIIKTIVYLITNNN